MVWLDIIIYTNYRFSNGNLLRLLLQNWFCVVMTLCYLCQAVIKLIVLKHVNTPLDI